MTGRALPPSSPFAADDGAADPALTAALAACVGGSGSTADVVAALAGVRVLVPVLAVEGAAPDAGPGTTQRRGAVQTEERQAWAGVMAVAAPDGRTALPVFSGVAALVAWRADARPVPVEGPRAAAAALQEGWDLLVVDPGSSAVVVPRPAVQALATGQTWRPAVESGCVRPEVRDAVLRSLDGLPDLLGADVAPGRRAEVAVLLSVRPGLSRAGLDALVALVSQRLAGGVADAVDSLELKVSGGGAG